MVLLTLLGLAKVYAQSSTTFESFTIGTVHYKGTGATVNTGPPGNYTVPSPYGSLWTLSDEWGFQKTGSPFDQEVKDDGFGNKVWRMSNAVTSTSFSFQPCSQSTALAAGETTAALYNDRGANHTTPITPPNPRAFAGTQYFHSGFKFKSATGTAQPGLALSVSPTPRQSSVRMSFVGLVDNGSTGFNLTFAETVVGGAFSSTLTIASNLSYSDWHRVDIYIEFVNGLNGDGTGNDIVTVLLNGIAIHTGTTWETFYASPSWTATPDPIAVDALMFRAGGTAVPASSGNGVYFDNVSCNNEPLPKIRVYSDLAGANYVNGYSTIQSAIDDATTLDGYLIKVDEGTYAMTTSVTVNKAVSIVGPNASISPVTGSRVTEAVLDFTNNTPAPGHITVNAAGAASIKGLKIVDDWGGTGAQRYGIYAFSSQGHLIQNNIFSRSATVNSGDEPRAIHLGIYSGGAGAMVDNNLFTGTSTGVFNNRSWRRGIWSDGGAPIVLTNNKFENIRSAINVENNPDDYTISGNSFDAGNGTAISFGIYNNGDLNYTLGANSFNSATYTLINLSSGPAGYVIDATACDLSGTAFPSLAIADQFNVEKLIVHGTNSGKTGRIIAKSGNVYVVSAVYGGAAKGSIQRGVDIASSGDVVNVKDGTYTENVTINKSLTLISADGAATTIIDGNSTSGELGTIFLPNNSTNITVGQIGKGFTIKGLDNADPGLEKAGVYLQGTQSNITIEGNIIEARGDAALMGDFNVSNNNIVINANQLTGATFTGVNPATGNQFTVPNVARQALVFGSGTGSANAMNFTFTNNTIATAAAGTSNGNSTLVTLDLGGTNDISNNFFTGSSIANALRVRGSGTYDINENSFLATYPIAILRVGASVNAECNWFGSSNGGTVASKISGTVDYQPFLSSGTDSNLSADGFQPASGSCSCAGTLTSTLTPTHVTCFGNSNGTIFNTIAGGTTPFSYSWNTSPVKTTKDINLLPAGTYTVVVTDAGGCGTTASATVNQPSAIAFNVSFVAGFNAIFTTSGGTPGYLYNRTGMTSNDYRVASDAIFTGLPANTSYIFKVKDANGCQKSVIKKTPAMMAPTGGGTKQQQVADRSEVEILTEGIFLFPNPADEFIQLEWLDEANATSGTVLISDAAGRIVRTQPAAKVSAETPLQIRLDNLSAGFYNLTFKTDGGKTHTQRFVIAKN